MKTTEIVNRGALNEVHLSQLVDQLDPSIGEATSVMGAMVTEVIRRSLRGGVLQIGRELNTYVGEQVERQIAEHRPLIEQTAAEAAQFKAAEVARGEVESLERFTREQDEHLAARIDDAAHHADEVARAIAKDVADRIDTSVELSQKLSERIDETSRQVNEATSTLARTVAQDLAAVEDRARAEWRQNLEEVRDRARKATAQIKERLDKLDVTSAELIGKHNDIRNELIAMLKASNDDLREHLAQMRQINDELLERIEKLERPRGIRGFFAWLFGRNKKPARRASNARDDDEAE